MIQFVFNQKKAYTGIFILGALFVFPTCFGKTEGVNAKKGIIPFQIKENTREAHRWDKPFNHKDKRYTKTLKPHEHYSKKQVALHSKISDLNQINEPLYRSERSKHIGAPSPAQISKTKKVHPKRLYH